MNIFFKLLVDPQLGSVVAFASTMLHNKCRQVKKTQKQNPLRLLSYCTGLNPETISYCLSLQEFVEDSRVILDVKHLPYTECDNNKNKNTRGE